MNPVLVFGGGNLVPGEHCANDEDLALLVSGSPGSTDHWLSHISTCDWCGERLHRLIEVHQNPLTAEEELILSKVAALQSERESRRTRPVRRWFGLTAGATAAAAVAVIVAGTLWWNARARGPESASVLLAKAYGEHRVFDMRVSDANYGPVRTERGSGSPLDKSLALLNAEAQIRQALENNPDDVQWLVLRGRAQLLEQEPDEAVKTLNVAVSKAPHDIHALTDLGVAYAERATTPTSGVDDPAKAIEYLERAKQQSPKDLDVLFNLGLVYEREKMYAMAEQAWKDYLEIDSKSHWAEEAKSHLSGLAEKHKGARLRQQLPRTPQAFLAQLDSGAEVYPEVLLDRIVFTDWPGKPEEDTALNRLAQLLVEKHDDRWLLEALRDREAFHILGSAIQANLDNDFEKAHEKAVSAEELYAKNGNIAGHFRAQAETSFALRRSANPACLRSLERKEGLDRIKNSYPWLYARLELEFAGCNSLLMRIGTALAASERALESVRKSHYGSLELFAASLVASYRGVLGDVRSVYKGSLDTIGLWWEGPYDGSLVHNLLLNLSSDSETSGYRFAAWAYKKEALTAFEPDAPLAMLALANSRLASSAVWIDKVDEAKRGYEEADRLFSLVPDSRMKRRYLDNAEKMRAEALAGTQPSTAVKFLQQGDTMPYPLEEMRRAQILGNLNRNLGNPEESEKAYSHAVQMAETRAQQVNAEGRRAEFLSDSEDAYRGLIASLIRNRSDWEGSYQHWEHFRSGTVREDQLHPQSEEAFLTYASLSGGVALWLHTDAGTRGAWLSAADDSHQSLIDKFVHECSSPAPGENWKITSLGLYEWLISPVEQYLAGKDTLIIESDAALSRIPFSALVDRDGRVLSDRFALVAVPNVASYLARVAGSPGLPQSSSAIVLADPELRGNMRRAYPDLPDAEIEASHIKAGFPNARVFRKAEATVDVLERFGITSSLVHFGGHGIGNARNGGLLMSAAGDGEADILDTSRIEKQNWKHCQLITLASCSAAREDRSEANSLTLVRAFLSAGARRVLAARWNVDSAVTAALMQQFYEDLAKGEVPSVALQNATAAVRARQPHPYYWAAFELFGYK